MSYYSAKQRSVASLLLVLILLLGVCCFTTHTSPIDFIVPVAALVLVLLLDEGRRSAAWREAHRPAREPYLPAAPDRAPPL
jgi:hypothetical protein